MDGAKLEIMTLHGRLDRRTDADGSGRELSEGGRTTATCQTDGDERERARIACKIDDVRLTRMNVNVNSENIIVQAALFLNHLVSCS